MEVKPSHLTCTCIVILHCFEDFGPMHAFWLFPFERYNGILGSQPTNTRSIEMQLMRRFCKDNAVMELCSDAKSWPMSGMFSNLMPDAIDDDYNELQAQVGEIELGAKYVLSSLSSNMIDSLRNLYAKLHNDFSKEILDGQINISTTFRRYKYITKYKRRINSTQNQHAKRTYVMATPVFQFTSSLPSEFDGDDRPAEVHFFLEHSISLPSHNKPISHILAHVSWPMVHPKQSSIGKPVEIWCHDLDEPTSVNSFIPVTAIKQRVIYSVDKVESESVLIVIPLVEW